MSWWTRARDHVRDEIDRFGGHVEEELNRFKRWYDKHGPEEVKINATSVDDGQTWEPKIEVKPRTIDQGYGSRSSYAAATNGNAYSRSTAATGGDIKQGGMTKDDIIEFNQKHPNETAQIGG